MQTEETENLSYASLLPERTKKKLERKTPFEPVTIPVGSRKKARREGRGRSSGHGKTCGRGQKGQKSRSGYSRRAGFEGGQMPLHRRLPKRGFKNIFRVANQAVNLLNLKGDLPGDEVNPKEMARLGIISNPLLPIKILGNGEISRPLKIIADSFSAQAREKIEAAGGSCVMRTAEDIRVLKKEIGGKGISREAEAD